MGSAASGVEIGEDAVKTGQRKFCMKAEIAVWFGSRMFVGEVTVVLANEEEVKQFFVDFLEIFDAFVGLWVGDVEAE